MIDIWTIKERLVEILQTDSDLYNDAVSANDVIREIKSGAPDENELTRITTLPSLFITNDDIIDNISLNGSYRDDNSLRLEHEIRVLLLLIVDGKDSQKAERIGDLLVKNIVDRLEKFPELEEPDTSESPESISISGTGIVLSHRPEQIAVLDRSLVGKAKQGRVIRLMIKVPDNSD